MKINITNTAKIDAALAEVQAKCRTRLLEPQDLLSAVEKAEWILGNLCLCKSAWQGCTVSLWPGKVANSYRGIPEGTAATITRGSTGWFLSGVSRVRCSSTPYGADRTEELRLTEEAKAALPSIYQL